VGTVDAFKQVLLKARTVAVPGSTSGIWLRTDLFPQLGIAERIRIEVGPRGSDATDMVAAGRADIAVMPTSEIVYAAGVDFAGNIAPDLASARASEAIRKSGMEPTAL
jgi:molybdate transport system substrate-binding protein